jgi:hypothetical protein
MINPDLSNNQRMSGDRPGVCLDEVGGKKIITMLFPPPRTF